MDPNTVVLEISSDEDVEWNDHGRGTHDDGGDSSWLAELSDEVNKGIYGGDFDEVVVVSESQKPVKKSKLKSSLVDLDDDCVVLDKDPNAAVEIRSDNHSNGDDDSDDIFVVSEKGQVACRDYPHSRHLCVKFPFSSTPNQSHCNQCYCYVCDSLAPCVYWGNGSASADHCHATDKDEYWKVERKNAKNGSKDVQPVSKLPPVHLYAQPPVMVQPRNQIPEPCLIHASHTSANFRSPDIINKYQTKRNKLHQDLVSTLVQKYNVCSRFHRREFKRTAPVRVATTANQTPYGSDSVRVATTANQTPYSSYRGNSGNPIRQHNYQVNGMFSGSSKYLGSVQLNAANTSIPYPPQSQTHAFSPTNQPQPQFSSHSNLKFRSRVNSNPSPENPLCQQYCVVPPSSSWPQSASSSQQTYVVPAQPSDPLPSETQVANPLIPVSDLTQNTSQGNQSQCPIMDPGSKDHGLGLPTSQDSAIPEGTGSTNESSLAAVSGGFANYQFDWIFDDQPIEPRYTDYSYDSGFIDTGPIFDF